MYISPLPIPFFLNHRNFFAQLALFSFCFFPNPFSVFHYQKWFIICFIFCIPPPSLSATKSNFLCCPETTFCILWVIYCIVYFMFFYIAKLFVKFLGLDGIIFCWRSLSAPLEQCNDGPRIYMAMGRQSADEWRLEELCCQWSIDSGSGPSGQMCKIITGALSACWH